MIERIKINKITRNSPSIELLTVFILDIPINLQGVTNKEAIAKSYSNKYGIIKIGDVEFFSFTDIFDFNNQTPFEVIKNTLVAQYEGVSLSTFTLQEYDLILNMYYNGTEWV
jgi:hypothetical protein